MSKDRKVKRSYLDKRNRKSKPYDKKSRKDWKNGRENHNSN